MPGKPRPQITEFATALPNFESWQRLLLLVWEAVLLGGAHGRGTTGYTLSVLQMKDINYYKQLWSSSTTNWLFSFIPLQRQDCPTFPALPSNALP